MAKDIGYMIYGIALITLSVVIIGIFIIPASISWWIFDVDK